MRQPLPILATLLAIASVQAVAADLVTPDCRYVGPPATASQRFDAIAACMRANPRLRRMLDDAATDADPETVPAAPRQAPRVTDPQPALDLSTGNLLLIAPIKP